MIWHRSFDQRLLAWNQLRHACRHHHVETALKEINQWWFSVPWVPYYLHWDDVSDWPDPWQLINDNIYCDVARGLGIMYTIAMLDRSDITDLRFINTENHNLVLVHKEKYILNWDSNTILNKNFTSIKVHRSIDQAVILQKIQ